MKLKNEELNCYQISVTINNILFRKVLKVRNITSQNNTAILKNALNLYCNQVIEDSNNFISSQK
jgi:hypothetical protein